MHGTYDTVEGRPAVRFERPLAHPVERVWRAVTEPEELAHWFPAGVSVDLRVGGAIAFALGDDGEVTELAPPRRFAFTWGEQLLRFELEPYDGGCLLRFTS